jgi:hypothetical protein
VDVAVFDDHITEIDADAEDDPLVLRRLLVPLGHAVLHRHRASDRFDNARKLDQDAVTRRFDDSAPMLGNLRVDQVVAMGAQSGQRARLVLAHQAAVAGYTAARTAASRSTRSPSTMFSRNFVPRILCAAALRGSTADRGYPHNSFNG